MSTYQQGLNDEAKVIEMLKKSFNQVRKSSKQEDIEYDIDVWIGDVAISIKAQHACLRTGNLGFELEVQNRQSGEWQKSWFHNGKAKGYIVMVGETLYMVNKQSLLSYVNKRGWDSVRNLTPQVKQMQEDINHRDADVKFGLLKLDDMLNYGIAKKLVA